MSATVVVGVLAGLVGKKIFARLWGLIDDEEPPSPEHREFSWPKLIAAHPPGDQADDHSAAAWTPARRDSP